MTNTSKINLSRILVTPQVSFSLRSSMFVGRPKYKKSKHRQTTIDLINNYRVFDFSFVHWTVFVIRVSERPDADVLRKEFIASKSTRLRFSRPLRFGISIFVFQLYFVRTKPVGILIFGRMLNGGIAERKNRESEETLPLLEGPLSFRPCEEVDRITTIHLRVFIKIIDTGNLNNKLNLFLFSKFESIENSRDPESCLFFHPLNRQAFRNK